MEEIDLKDFLSYLRKFIPAIIIVAAAAVAGVFFYDTNIKTPLYTTYTKVLLTQNNENQNASTTLNDITVNQKLASTYSEIVRSRLVLQQVIDRLWLDYNVEQLSKNITVTSVDDTQVLKISVTDKDPARAQLIANTTTEIFAHEITDITGLDNVKPYESAELPGAPSNNTLTRDLVIAGIIAVFGVLAIAFIIFYFDDTVKYSDELEKKIGLPIVGKILKSDVKQKKNNVSELYVDKYPKSGVSESIKSLRTNLQFSSVDEEVKTILVTSSMPSEGKSFVSANLAISFAQNGDRVLIIDSDMRKGRLHRIFKVPNVLGYSNLMTDKITNINRYVQKTSIQNLKIVTRGAYPPNPSELLSSNKNKKLIEKFREFFDVIIFDGAPCNGITDSVVLSTLIDKVLIVTKDGHTPRSVLNATRDALQKVNAPIAGVVMNNVDKKATKYYGYYSDGTPHRSHKG